jgi:acyl CoA:acetate/3-ketoacid CoA transferase beta subunit
MSPRRADICVAAVSDAFATQAEILISPMGLIPSIGGKLARLTHSPQLMMSDGVSTLVTPEGLAEADLPYHEVFHLLWSSKRHVMMGASQIDAFGNQNISCIGDHDKPKAMLIGARGAPGNSLYNRCSYWIPKQSARVLCERVDFVCGVGNDRASELGGMVAKHHDLHRVISNLGVFCFDEQGRLELMSLHPGVLADELQAACAFPLDLEGRPSTRLPTQAEMELIESLDPDGLRYREVPS